MPAFVLEIGTEELPSRFLVPAEKELAERFSGAFSASCLTFSGLSVYATPRRLLASVAEMNESSIFREEVITGPSVKAAYDVGGRPTRAAEGFARTHGVPLDATFTMETEKGAYIAVRKNIGGENALGILSRICPAIVSGLYFPKRMRWGSGDFTFARPVRWIVALLGNAVVPFTVGETASGNSTWGHRVHGPGPFTVERAEYLEDVLRDQCRITVNEAERRRMIVQGGDILAAERKGVVLWKDSLLDEVQGLCEHPAPILGGFDPAYLELPREVLLTSMEMHQKSFGVEGNEGRLLPYFLTVLNITPKDVSRVRKGWERVLRARLEDARFFWKVDMGTSFDSWLASLDSVVFLAPLGSMGDKTRRVAELCGWLADTVRMAGEKGKVSRDNAMRAGRLSKADLVSAMVNEFDTLQGIMGGIYAAHAGESNEVATAIAEQYLPTGPDSPVPASLCGALLSLADKADTLAGCFGLGMIPTGAADPYGLRRAALGIARIALDKGLRFHVGELFANAMRGYGKRDWKLLPEQALPRLEEFFMLRLKNYYIANGVETLMMDAALGAGFHDVWAVSARLSALVTLSNTSEFAGSVLTFKRAANIIRKQGQETGVILTGKYVSALFTDDAERELARKLERIAPLFDQLWSQDNYLGLFALLEELRPAVDAFFESVMVMCDDETQRLNRLNLLQALVTPLSRLADFSALQM
jgi:glycyl-tRNA synthetase beta chain